MRYRLLSWAVMLVLVAPAAARAQNREHLQLEADLRILQEQIGRLQLANNQLAEQLKATTKRLDDLTEANVKQFADQKVALDQAQTSLNEVKEKLQTNDVRVSQLTQEMSAIRDGIRMLATRVNALVDLLQPPQANAAPGGDAGAAGNAAAPPAGSGTPGAPAGPLPPVVLPSSAGRIYDSALGDYMSGRYDNAVDGFRELIQKYPDSPLAANAQFQIAVSFYDQKNCREANTEFQKLIATYKTSEHLAEAYYMQGLCYLDLNQRANAQKMFDTVIKQYPDSTYKIMATQKMQALGARP